MFVSPQAASFKFCEEFHETRVHSYNREMLSPPLLFRDSSILNVTDAGTVISSVIRADITFDGYGAT
jgi:hypothetical protein